LRRYALEIDTSVLLAPFAGSQVSVPGLYIAGDRDLVVRTAISVAISGSREEGRSSV
jgi:hypothetical protein